MFDEKTGMNRSYGTKWFTFYAKVRPWFVLVFSIMAIMGTLLVNFEENFSDYDNALSSFFGLVFAIVNIVLSIMTLVKSEGHYGKFVKFVESVLFYDLITFAIMANIIGLALAYFIWYRPNVKYFRKRLSHFHAIRYN